MTHYRAFIDMAEGLEATRAELEGVSQHLDGLLADLPALSEACEAFTGSASRFSAGRAQNKQLLSALPHQPQYHPSDSIRNVHRAVPSCS